MNFIQAYFTIGLCYTLLDSIGSIIMLCECDKQARQWIAANENEDVQYLTDGLLHNAGSMIYLLIHASCTVILWPISMITTAKFIKKMFRK